MQIPRVRGNSLFPYPPHTVHAQLIASRVGAAQGSEEPEPVAAAAKPPSPPPAKRAKPEQKRPAEHGKAPKPEPGSETAAPIDQTLQSGGAKRQLSAATLRLRAMCKRATIGIAPSVYVQNKTDAGLHEALVQLLAKHGLSKSSGVER